MISPGSRWKQVNKALVRAFIVPTTFQPNCGFPEVSDACTIQISGLNGLTATSKGTTGSFGFPATCTSRLLERCAHGRAGRSRVGWIRGTARLARRGDRCHEQRPAPIAFAGTQAVAIPLRRGAT